MKRPYLITLGLLGLASIAIYIGAFAAPYDLVALAAQGASADLGRLTDYSLRGFALYIGAVGALFALYGLAIWRSRGLQGGRSFALVMITGAVSALILCLVYPYGAADVFLYVVRGRVLGVFGMNSLMAPPSAYPTDTYLPFFSEWTQTVSPYGPLWEFVAALAAKIGSGSRVRSLLAFKGVALLSYLVCCWLVYRILAYRRSALALTGLIAFAWNPLVLLETHAMGHNDLLMMVFVLAAVYLWERRQYSWAIAALVAGGLVKYIPLALLPATLLLMKRRLAWRAWLIACLEGGLISAALTVASFARLWPGLRYLNVLQQAGRMHTSPAVALAMLLMSVTDEDSAYTITMWVSRAAFAAAYLAALWRIWRGRDDLPQAYYRILYAWLVCGAAAFGYWYILWLMALCPLTGRVRSQLRAVIFSLTGSMSVPIYTFIGAWVGFKFGLIYAFSIPFIFALPFRLARVWEGRVDKILYSPEAADARARLPLGARRRLATKG